MQIDNVVRLLKVSPNCVPNFIIYTDRQIHELKSFCFNHENESILGFDKTYMLESTYVTASSCKNLALKRIRNDECPIFIGPIFIHGHTDVEIFSIFVSYLAIKLTDCDQNMCLSWAQTMKRH